METAPLFGRASSVSKVTKFGWSAIDIPGTFMMIPKNEIHCDLSYQRQSSHQKVIAIARDWSWMACGVIIVASRDGKYYAIDGYHRVLAAMNRADIKELPCMMFETDGNKREAIGFLSLNTNRKNINSSAKFHAALTAGDEVATKVDYLLKSVGLVVTNSGRESPGTIRCIAAVIRAASDCWESFERTISLCAFLCRSGEVKERLFMGLRYIDKNGKTKLSDPRLYQRITRIGASKLIDSANRSSAFYARGGDKIWAIGMENEINKGLKKPIELITALEVTA